MAFTWKNIFDPSGVLVGGGLSGNKGLLNASSGVAPRDTYNQQLQGRLGGIQPPNLTNMYQQYRSDVMGSVKPPTDLSKYYDTARQNLNQTVNSQVADTSAQAGALAASRGLANPTAFVSNQANNVRQSFNPQFGQLDQSQALQTAQQQDEYNRYLTQLMMSLGQGGINAAQGDFGNQTGLFNLYAGLAGNYDPYSERDKMYQLGGQAAQALPFLL